MEPAEIKDLTESLIHLKTITAEACQPDAQKAVATLIHKMRLLFVEQAVAEVMSKHYDLGQVTAVTRLFGGLINQNFSVATNDGNRRHRFFIKRYRKEADVKEILLEHKFNQHLIADGFPEIAKVLPSREGSTFVEYPVAHLDPPDMPSKFAVYSYLEGEDRYAWCTPHCNMSELASASAMFAKIHERGFGFDPGEYAKDEPKITKLMDEFPKYFAKFEAKSKGSMQGSKSAVYFLEKLPSYIEALGRCRRLKEACKGMLQLIVHGDYHPGNQKYTGNSVSGVFDFDWCKEDLRLFDVAMTITYFCTSWKKPENGVLFLDEIEVLLKAYQEKLETSDHIFPLTREELAVLPEMIILANMYVIWWDLRELFEVETSESDEDECLVFLEHNTNINDFTLANLEKIRAVAKKISQ